jgi:hypothetical protein
MGKSARPNYCNKTQKCIRCGELDFPLTSVGECRRCNPNRFFKEYQEGKKK